MHKLEWFLSRKVSLGSSRGTMMLSAVVPMQISLVFSAAGGLEDYAENATVGLLNYHTMKNGFYLGYTEFRDLAGPVDWQQLADLGVTTDFLNICIYLEEDGTRAQCSVMDFLHMSHQCCLGPHNCT